MTEEEWPSCVKPNWLLHHVCPISDRDPRMRKVVLFTAGCLRRVWDGIEGDEFRRAVEAVERAAESPDKFYEVRAAYGELRRVRNRTRAQDAVVEALSPTSLLNAAVAVARCAASFVAGKTDNVARRAEMHAQSELFRDLFGNPFRPVSPDPMWSSGAVVALAESAYSTRDFAALPVLADALEEAGCTDEQVLAHCRVAGAHARGCWVVDLALGR